MPPAVTPFRIVIPLYPAVDLMDVAAPREIFSWMAESWSAAGPVEVLLAAESDDPVPTRDGTRILPDVTFDAVPSVDVIWVPGAGLDGLQAAMADEYLLETLRGWAQQARWVTSVCEGALVLASAGLLDGYQATTHWAFLPCLCQFEGITVIGGDGDFPRFVVDPGTGGGAVRVTGAGISAGLDEALQLVQMIAGDSVAESVQQTIQYYPDPPVSAPLPVPGTCPLSS
ncbi:MAG TPA: DJ-1/PfpI family protein [Longimicrobium sp.]